MTRRLLALLSAAACCFLTGCLAVQATRPVDVVVTRADTGEPAAGVTVSSYRYCRMGMIRFNPVNEFGLVIGTTDAAGRVTLPLCDRGSGETTGTGLSVDRGPSTGRDEWQVRAGTVRRGGVADKHFSGPGEYRVELVARRRWLIEHLLPPYDPWRGIYEHVR